MTPEQRKLLELNSVSAQEVNIKEAAECCESCATSAMNHAVRAAVTRWYMRGAQAAWKMATLAERQRCADIISMACESHSTLPIPDWCKRPPQVMHEILNPEKAGGE